MVFGHVIKCPDCAGMPTAPRKAATRVRAAAGTGAGEIVTRVLAGLIVAVYLLQAAAAGDYRGLSGRIYVEGALYGPYVADGEWWRLVTSSFLHAGPIHLLFNVLMLWWFGRPLENLLGRGRFVGIYAVSALCGAAGALLVAPERPTIGASGAVFGILGAGVVLERRRIPVFGGAAFMVVAFNLVFSFLLSNVTVGGHVGGLAGGVLAMLALSNFGRKHAVHGRIGAVEVGSLVAVAAVSVAIAYARVRGLA
jgi:membrane associated rhomboid family serine protease